MKIALNNPFVICLRVLIVIVGVIYGGPMTMHTYLWPFGCAMLGMAVISAYPKVIRAPKPPVV